jgi:hypothetical protein
MFGLGKLFLDCFKRTTLGNLRKGEWYVSEKPFDYECYQVLKCSDGQSVQVGYTEEGYREWADSFDNDATKNQLLRQHNGGNLIKASYKKDLNVYGPFRSYAKAEQCIITYLN